MNIFYLYVIIGVLSSSAAQILLKKSAQLRHKSKICELLNFRVLFAYFILLIVMFVNILGYKSGIAVKELPVIESLGYIFVPILSYIFLKERIQIRTIVSVFFIILGIIVFYS